MNSTVKTILLTVLTLSLFAIALVELSGVSSTALFNKYGIGEAHNHETETTSPKDQASQDDAVSKMPKTTIEIINTKHDFGTITEGDVVKHTWKVKNTGANPLVISNVQASCGCTAPSFTKDPIAPGAEGEVTLEFNSQGRPGKSDKNALIVSNADMDKFSIGFTAQVNPKK